MQRLVLINQNKIDLRKALQRQRGQYHRNEGSISPEYTLCVKTQKICSISKSETYLLHILSRKICSIIFPPADFPFGISYLQAILISLQNRYRVLTHKFQTLFCLILPKASHSVIFLLFLCPLFPI